MSTVWYFAYGSNMQTATFRERRGIECLCALPARLNGWRLVLDKPSPLPLGHSFANIVTDDDATTFGVLYEVTQDDLAHIDLTEGVLIGNYDRIEVAATPIGGMAPNQVRAFTLTATARDPGLRPSDRYMELLIEGAVEHGLPAEYIDFLRGIPSQPETPESREARAMIDQFFKSAADHRSTTPLLKIPKALV